MSNVTVPRVLRLLWGQEEATGRRGPKPTLTVADIAAAAVRIADTDGLAAVSMAKVAGELSFTSMSLYRYIEGKEDLYVLMLDRAYGRYPAAPAGDWRVRTEHWAHAQRAVFLRHPWVTQIPVHEPPLAPHQVAWMEAGLDALAGTGLPEPQQLMAMLLVDNYVRGQAQLGGPAPTDQPGFTDYGERLTQLIDAERFPRLWAAMTSGALTDDDSTDALFAAGLATVLAGVDSLRTASLRSGDVTGSDVTGSDVTGSDVTGSAATPRTTSGRDQKRA